MNIQERLALLNQLGEYLRAGDDPELNAVVQQCTLDNPWFTPDNTYMALKSIGHYLLDAPKLEKWINNYAIPDCDFPVKTIGIVMAGNLPLVGFHDWLCVFTAGFRAKVKLSEKDRHLLPFLVKKMAEWNFESWAYTEFCAVDAPLRDFDAVIATGSNNTARYFEQYFSKYPHIIRRNRNGVAVLNGLESQEALLALGVDIFSYFGLGCRNVSKLYVPKNYDFNFLLESLHTYNELILHHKYKNNFDYNFTLFILNKIPFYNNGCLLLREDPSLSARIASVHYEYYQDLTDLLGKLAPLRDQIQVLAANYPIPSWTITQFGKSQQPELTDYPDGVDVMDFLTALS
ncbi:MAG: acyl-CoA reductase [Bacteroidetes bacterium]|nr:acyl-CoA reductase [Bacteroidota bacterium]